MTRIQLHRRPLVGRFALWGLGLAIALASWSGRPTAEPSGELRYGYVQGARYRYRMTLVQEGEVVVGDSVSTVSTRIEAGLELVPREVTPKGEIGLMVQLEGVRGERRIGDRLLEGEDWSSGLGQPASWVVSPRGETSAFAIRGRPNGLSVRLVEDVVLNGFPVFPAGRVGESWSEPPRGLSREGVTSSWSRSWRVAGREGDVWALEGDSRLSYTRPAAGGVPAAQVGGRGLSTVRFDVRSGVVESMTAQMEFQPTEGSGLRPLRTRVELSRTGEAKP